MVSVADKNWYVIRSVTGQETKVKQYIMTELTRVGLDKQVEEILVPTEKVIQIRQGKKVQKEKTYFHNKNDSFLKTIHFQKKIF